MLRKFMKNICSVSNNVENKTRAKIGKYQYTLEITVRLKLYLASAKHADGTIRSP